MNFSIEQEVTEDTSFEVNVTSFIDVLFTLLLFFMVSTSFAAPQGLDVRLPSAETGKTTTEDRELMVTVKQDGELRVNGNLVDLGELEKQLAEAKQKSGNPTLVVQADRDTAHGKVIEIMDLARRNGIQQISIATVPKG